MDASALLKSQGWRGKGYSLHPSNNNIGLSKPILIARNTDGRGIGQKPHVTSDTWWLDAFDQKLKGLDTSKKGTVTQSVDKGKLDVIIATGKPGKYTGASGLYASFVSGGMLEGTLKYNEGVSSTTTSTTDATPVSSSSEDDDDDDDSSSTSGSGSVAKRKTASKSKKSKKESMEGETKQERRMRREARRLRKAEKAATKEARKSAKKEAKKALKENETKEERRARRIARRARKEAKRSKRAKEAVS